VSVRDVGCRGGQQTPHCGITGDENGGICYFFFFENLCQFVMWGVEVANRLLTTGITGNELGEILFLLFFNLEVRFCFFYFLISSLRDTDDANCVSFLFLQKKGGFARCPPKPQLKPIP
jgi:hypothetical protein